jgi:hypothetical protein
MFCRFIVESDFPFWSSFAYSQNKQSAEDAAAYLTKHGINSHLGLVINKIAKDKPKCAKAAILKYFVQQHDSQELAQLGIRVSKTTENLLYEHHSQHHFFKFLYAKMKAAAF